jgi:hypothetical protein
MQRGNPFADLIGTGSAQGQAQQGQGGGYEQLFAQYRPRPKQPKKKDFWTDQISTGGGIGGALGGAATGAAIGSIVPGIGTAIGGLVGGIAGGALGSGAGEFGENVITGEKDKFKNVGKEALLGGAFSAPPVRLARGLAGVAKGGGKVALEEALQGTAKKGGSKLIQNMGAKTYAQAFNIPRKFTGKLKPEQTAKDLMRYGVGGGLDKIEATSNKALSKLGGILDKSVKNVGGDIKVDDVGGVFKNLEKYNIPKGEIQALRRSVTDIGTSSRMPGYENPTQMLESIRELEKRGYDLIKAGESNLSRNPNQSALGEAYLQAAQGLEDNLYTAITSKGTIKALQTEANKKALNGIAKGLGDEFVKVTDPKELRSLMSPFVRSRQLVNLTRDEAQSAGTQGMSNIAGRGVGSGTGAVVGSMVGGPIGAAVGAGTGFLAAPILRGAQEAVQAPISTAVGKGLSKLGGGATAGAGRGPVKAATGGLIPETLRQSVGRGLVGAGQAQPQSLEDSLLQQSQGPETFTEEVSVQEQPAEQSPYTRENLMYDMQRDPENAENYIAYYQSLQEVYAPPEQDSNLNATQAQRATSAQNALADIPMIEEAISSGQIGGLRAVPGAQTPIGRRLLGTEDLDAALFNIADNILRARTGAAAPEAEVRNFMENFLPNALDSNEAQKSKLQRAIAELQGFMNPVASSGTSLEDILMQQQEGAF